MIENFDFDMAAWKRSLINESLEENEAQIFPIEVNSKEELDKNIINLKKQGYNLRIAGEFPLKFPLYITNDSNKNIYINLSKPKDNNFSQASDKLYKKVTGEEPKKSTKNKFRNIKEVSSETDYGKIIIHLDQARYLIEKNIDQADNIDLHDMELQLSDMIEQLNNIKKFEKYND